MADWDPDTYLQLMNEEIPDYELLQEKLVAALPSGPVHAVLDLGTGSGETAKRVLQTYPEACLRGIDSSDAMLAAARRALAGHHADLTKGRLEDPLPEGPFDLIVSALCVHHLGGAAKSDLFRRVAKVMAAEARFVLADVVVPEDPADAVIALEDGYDIPSRVDEQLGWLKDAGLRPTVFWTKRDLAVITAERRNSPSS